MIDEKDPDLRFPVVIWGTDFLFKAESYAALERGSKSDFKRLKGQALKGCIRLLDTQGVVYQIVDINQKSYNGLIDRLLGSVRNDYVYHKEKSLNVSGCKIMLNSLIERRLRHDRENFELLKVQTRISEARSVAEVVMAMPLTF